MHSALVIEVGQFWDPCSSTYDRILIASWELVLNLGTCALHPVIAFNLLLRRWVFDALCALTSWKCTVDFLVPHLWIVIRSRNRVRLLRNATLIYRLLLTSSHGYKICTIWRSLRWWLGWQVGFQALLLNNLLLLWRHIVVTWPL
jgi:hypothetical protein